LAVGANTTGDKLLSGAKLLGSIVANTAMGAGKLTQAALEAQSKELEKIQDQRDK
jgi:hypothetical protein